MFKIKHNEQSFNRKKNQNEMEGYIKPSEALAISGVSSETLRRWFKEGKIRALKTKTNRYKYHREDLLGHLGLNSLTSEKETREKICYCRVSSKKQLDDLERQKLYLGEKFPSYRVVTDVGSGLNWKRKGLQAILELAFQGNLDEVVVAHRDRLSRIAFELIEWILHKKGAKITVIDQEEHRTSEQELAEDLLSIVTIYSCKQMGKRRYKIKKDSSKTNTESENSSEEMD